jgi:FtsH-binding integral membrane protein
MPGVEPEYTETPEDEGIVRTFQKNIISLTLLGIAGLCILFLISDGAFQNEDAQAIIIWLVLILIMLSIIIMMREKLMMVLILYGAFALTYLIEGYIIKASGISDNFSWGVITFGMISLFVYATGLQKNFTQKHLYIIVVFIMVSWLLNEGGWMATGNTITSDLLSRFGELSGIIWR